LLSPFSIYLGGSMGVGSAGGISHTTSYVSLLNPKRLVSPSKRTLCDPSNRSYCVCHTIQKLTRKGGKNPWVLELVQVVQESLLVQE
jgi:hypothetical protein